MSQQILNALREISALKEEYALMWFAAMVLSTVGGFFFALAVRRWYDKKVKG